MGPPREVSWEPKGPETACLLGGEELVGQGILSPGPWPKVAGKTSHTQDQLLHL